MHTSEYKLRNGDPLIIRVGSANDAAAVLEFLETVSGETEYLSFGQGEFDMTLEEETAYLESSRTAENRLYLIARHRDNIVATLSFDGGRRPRIRHVGELGISVRESHWGRGIGDALMTELIDWARANTVVTKINLRVRVDNERAISLYRKKGFEIEGTIRNDLCVDGRYHDHFAMGLVL